MPNVDSHHFRQLMGRFATGVTVITTHDHQKEMGVGITINSLTSVSLKPPLVLFCLEKKAHSFMAFKKEKYFAVNILAENQENLSRQFALPNQPPLPARSWAEPVKDCPILNGTLGWMLCQKMVAYPGGDHIIFVGKVLQIQISRKTSKPLIYFIGDYQKLDESRK